MAELRSLLQSGDKAVIYAITIDPADKSIVMAGKVAKDGKGEINFPLLSDPNHKTIDAYGLYDPAYTDKNFDGIPHPAVYVLDKNRKVLWAKIESDYRFRPTNEEIRTALEKVRVEK